MKSIFLLILTSLFILPVQAQNTLKLMSYNIRNGNGMDNICNYQRIADVINKAAPDIVLSVAVSF